mmetsp:Transcript_5065/g.13146  ORF Transcript_5065/g.13146 Transcript_5065/m.13146 type:complete len:227 (+) Transcript_5065:203-883(+)
MAAERLPAEYGMPCSLRYPCCITVHPASTMVYRCTAYRTEVSTASATAGSVRCGATDASKSDSRASASARAAVLSASDAAHLASSCPSLPKWPEVRSSPPMRSSRIQSPGESTVPHCPLSTMSAEVSARVRTAAAQPDGTVQPSSSPGTTEANTSASGTLPLPAHHAASTRRCKSIHSSWPWMYGPHHPPPRLHVHSPRICVLFTMSRRPTGGAISGKPSITPAIA